ncbi:hypothetical protein BDZ45DRAFT_507816 [Acephala macrosclerotiorum]|nr:hypothetical protein BDZ45DRAFT_507816 [Acephala macrosclerotiorum]
MAMIDGETAHVGEHLDEAQDEQEVAENNYKLVVLAGEVSEDGVQENAFDLVAVHGLYGDPRETWTADGESNTWLEKNVHETYPNSRVMTFGYSNEVSRKGIATRISIREKALQLLEELLELRKGLQPGIFQPLIFVAHDMGGIIVKEALSIATLDYPKWSTIVHSTRLLFFFGVPQRAESKWDMEDKIANFLFANAHRPVLAVNWVKEISRSVLEINEAFVASKFPTICKIVSIASAKTDDSNDLGFDIYTSTMNVAFEDKISSKSHRDMTKEVNSKDFNSLVNQALTGYSLLSTMILLDVCKLYRPLPSPSIRRSQHIARTTNSRGSSKPKAT